MYRLIGSSLCLLALATVAFGEIPRAISNARSGLDSALATTLRPTKKSARFEVREEGSPRYKVSVRRIDDHTVKIKVTGYNGLDEAVLTTIRMVDDGRYTTIEEYRKSRRAKGKEGPQ